MFRIVRLSPVLMLLCAAVPAQAAKLSDLAWLAGHWAATGESHVEEIWSEPMGGTMTGMFRLVSDGKSRVLEYVVISEEKDGVFYRFKHFNPDYTTWEKDGPPLALKLEKTGDKLAVFKNVTKAENQPDYISYRLEKDGTLMILVGEAPDESAGGEIMKFILRRR